jgi:hypothetical protein
MPVERGGQPPDLVGAGHTGSRVEPAGRPDVFGGHREPPERGRDTPCQPQSDRRRDAGDQHRQRDRAHAEVAQDALGLGEWPGHLHRAAIDADRPHAVRLTVDVDGLEHRGVVDADHRQRPLARRDRHPNVDSTTTPSRDTICASYSANGPRWGRRSRPRPMPATTSTRERSISPYSCERVDR